MWSTTRHRLHELENGIGVDCQQKVHVVGCGIMEEEEMFRRRNLAFYVGQIISRCILTSSAGNEVESCGLDDEDVWNWLLRAVWLRLGDI